MRQKILLQFFCKLWLGLCAIFTWVSDHARVSLTPFGERYTEQVTCLSFHEYGVFPFSPFNEEKVNPRVRAYGKSVGWAQNAIPVVVQLKEPHLFAHKEQYPLKPEVKEGLKLTIENLKEQGLLIPCNSPCNTPILGIKKSNDKWRLVQDLWIINEAVVPLHPVVPNPLYAVVWNSWTGQIFLSN